MASNLRVEAPAFDRIRAGDDGAVEDAVRLLWLALNYQFQVENTNFLRSSRILSPAVLTDAPSANQDNYDMKDNTILLLTGSSAFNLTGIRNGASGRLVLIVNLGSATCTVKHDVTSTAENRINMQAGADKGITTGKAMLLCYLSSRWREVSLA